MNFKQYIWLILLSGFYTHVPAHCQPPDSLGFVANTSDIFVATVVNKKKTVWTEYRNSEIVSDTGNMYLFNPVYHLNKGTFKDTLLITFIPALKGRNTTGQLGNYKLPVLRDTTDPDLSIGDSIIIFLNISAYDLSSSFRRTFSMSKIGRIKSILRTIAKRKTVCEHSKNPHTCMLCEILKLVEPEEN